MCAQPFGWLTLVEVLETLLLLRADVQKPGEVNLAVNKKGRARGASQSYWATVTGLTTLLVPTALVTCSVTGYVPGFA